MVAIAKDRVPLALPVPPQAQSRPLELHLLRGLALEVFVKGSTVARFVDLLRDVTHIEIELASDAVIAGSLLLPDGTPANGTVQLWEWAGDHRESEVAKDGTFGWDGLGAGEYRLTAESDAGAVASRVVVLRDGESAECLRLVVEPGGRVSGTITGHGEHVTVVVRNRNGQTILERELGNDAYSLQGVRDGATIAARTTVGRILGRSVRLDDLGEARVDLDFSGNARLKGTVSADGRPLGGIEITVVPKDRSRPTAHATTSGLGRYGRSRRPPDVCRERAWCLVGAGWDKPIPYGRYRSVAMGGSRDVPLRVEGGVPS